GSIVLAKSAVNDRDGDSITVEYLGIYGNPVFRPRQHLSESPQLKIAGLQTPHLLLERLTEPIQMIGLMRNHEAGKLKLVVESAHIIAPGSVQIETGDVRMVRGTIVVHGRGSGQICEVSTNPTTNMPGEIASDHVVRVGKTMGKLWTA